VSPAVSRVPAAVRVGREHRGAGQARDPGTVLPSSSARACRSAMMPTKTLMRARARHSRTNRRTVDSIRDDATVGKRSPRCAVAPFTIVSSSGVCNSIRRMYPPGPSILPRLQAYLCDIHVGSNPPRADRRVEGLVSRSTKGRSTVSSSVGCSVNVRAASPHLADARGELGPPLVRGADGTDDRRFTNAVQSRSSLRSDAHSRRRAGIVGTRPEGTAIRFQGISRSAVEGSNTDANRCRS
jgi:hypothetical protein